MTKKKMLSILGIIVITIISITIFYTYSNVTTLPTLTIESNSKSIVLKPSSFDYENKVSLFSINKKQTKDNTLNLNLNSTVDMNFNITPHEYNLSVEKDKHDLSSVKFNEKNQFSAENKKGVFKYSLKTLSYDKGMIEYIFYININ